MERTLKLSLEKARELYGKYQEMDELILANFTKEELEKKELPKSWWKLDDVRGFGISTNDSKIYKTLNEEFVSMIFATQKQAKSALAMAQLSQLKKVYNDDWEADFSNNEDKFTIGRSANVLYEDTKTSTYHFLAFKSKEIRSEFLKNFKQLIWEYFEL